MGSGNTQKRSLEATMKRLEKLREYRSRLVAESNTSVDKLIAAKENGTVSPQLIAKTTEHVRRMQFRIQRINTEVDRLIAADPRVLQPAH